MEKRIIAYAMACIQCKDRSEENMNNKKYRIPVVYFRQVFGLSENNGKLYSDLKKSCEKLRELKVHINGNDINLFNMVIYNKGYIDVSFSDKMKPHLSNLKGNYTNYNLYISHCFKSIYSIRIYELLQTRQDTNIKIMSIEEFKKALGLTKSYQYPSLIKHQIVNKVIKEFKDNLNVELCFKFIKDRRYAEPFRVEFSANENNKALVKKLTKKNKKSLITHRPK